MHRFLFVLAFIFIKACSSLPTDYAADGDLNAINEELSKGVDINGLYEKKTMLGAAAEAGQTHVVRELLMRGADIEKGDSYYYGSPLVMALSKGHIDTVRLLISSGADVNSTKRYREDPVLHRAANYSSPKIVQLLLDSGADLLAVNKYKENAAHETYRQDQNLRILILEAKRRDAAYAKATGDTRPYNLYKLLNNQSYDGSTALHVAAHSQHGLDTVRLLLQSGANPNLKANEQRFWDRSYYDSNVTPLHLAADSDNKKSMKLLLQYGADPNAVTSRGETAQSLNRASPWASSSFDFGQVIAIAGGAALASQSNLSSVQQAEFMTNYTADVLTDSGGTNTRAWGAEATQKANVENGNTKSGLGKAEAKLMETYINNYKCPESGTVINNQKVEAYSQACLNAAVYLMKTLGCNMLKDRPAAEERCASNCGGNRQCLDLPPGGAAASTGKDADMDFLNSMGQ